MDERRSGGALVVPAVVVLVGWFAAPLIRTILLGAPELDWVVDTQVSTVVNSALWVVGGVLGTTALALLLAALAPRGRGASILGGLLLVPSGVTLAVGAVAWRASFAFRPAGRDQVGIVNEVVTTAGLSPVAWLTQEPLVNTVVLVTAFIWAATGLATLALAAAIRAVPDLALVSARTSGASEVQLFRRLILPAIRVPLAGVVLVLTVVAIRTHDLVRVATGGWFGTDVLATESIERSFVEGQAGRGAALAVVMVVLILPLAALCVRRSSDGRTAARSLADQVEDHTDHLAIAAPGRHSARRREAERAAADGPRGGALRLRLVGFVVLVWSVPLAAIGLIALRPADATADTGWWHVVSDRRLTLDNLRAVLDAGGMWAGFVDSLLIAVPATILVVGLAFVSARALAVCTPSTSIVLKGALIVAAMLPLPAVLPPLLAVHVELGIDGTWPGIWLAHAALGLPLATLLLASSARDRMASGQAASGNMGARIAAVAAVTFLLVWNDYLVAATFLGGADGAGAPLTVRLAGLVASQGERLPLVAAGALVTAVVPVVVLVSMRRQLVALVLGRDE
ncbi:MAG: ABC transporter permease subunit [Acidimicrobiia bacterium]|nr:ABC transporter permease subunit [Acidimicrobiia bacterium]